MNISIAAIKHYFSQQPVKRVYLFGSMARNEATFQSDIDLLVELDENVDLFQFAEMQWQLEELLKSKVDLVSTNGISQRFRSIIDKDKYLIHEN
jgi:predicted nucleotidyltransferase